MGLCSSSATDENGPRDHSFYKRSSNEEEELLKLPSLHNAPVHSLCPIDQVTLATATNDKKLLIYNWAEHVLKHSITIPTKPVTQVAYSIASRWIYAGSRCGLIYGWEWSNDQVVSQKTLTKHSLAVTCISCSIDQPHLMISGSRDNSVSIWDTLSGTCIRSQEISRNLPTGIKWIPNEPNMAVQSSEDKTIKVWDMRTCCVVQQSAMKQHLQLCCDASQDDHYILSGSSGCINDGAELTLWDRRVLNGPPLAEFFGHHGNVNSCKFLKSMDGKNDLLVSCSSDSTVKLWNCSIRDHLYSHHISNAGPITELTVVNPLLIACSTFNDGVSVWDVAKTPPGGLDLRSKY